MAETSLSGWFKGQIPNSWFEGTPEITTDRDEIWVVGRLAEPDFTDDDGDDLRRDARLARIAAFREDTRADRVTIARRAERAFDRKVSWGARCGDQEAMFTILASPAMTRLRMPEREVLDTLVDVGVARSRSDALAWCVRLVGERQEDWLAELREALEQVREVRRRGPAA